MDVQDFYRRQSRWDPRRPWVLRTRQMLEGLPVAKTNRMMLLGF